MHRAAFGQIGRGATTEILEVINAYLDGSLTDDQHDQLAHWLRASPENVDRFVRECQLHAMLRDTLRGPANGFDGGPASESADAAAEVVPAIHTNSPALPTMRINGLRQWAISVAVAAVVLIGISLGLTFLLIRGTNENRPQAPLGAPVATVIGQDGAVWEGEPLEELAELPPGPLRLASGEATVRLGSGATVTMAGPATFDLLTSNSVRLQRGTMRAVVPAAAKGFIAVTPAATIVDLGTRFNVTVDSAGTADIAVVQGSVEVRQPGAASPVVLIAGQSRHVSAAAESGNDPDSAEFGGEHADDPGLLREVED